MNTSALLASVLSLATCVPGLAAQRSDPTDHASIHGVVRDTQGGFVRGADVFLAETLEGTGTDTAGAFTFRTRWRGSATLVVRALGYGTVERAVTVPTTAPVSITLDVRTVDLPPLEVRAGAFEAGGGEDASLTSLEVVSTPGSHGDVFQALKTFPGMQPAEEGASLYVRGGDVSETKVVVNGATVRSPYKHSAGAVSFGVFDPFELDGIAFSSGGFGARHGDALSGLVELETMGTPDRSSADVTVSLAAASARLAWLLTEGVGVRASATRSSTGAMFALNGHDTDFSRVPESRDASASLAWDYRPGGTVKLFAYDEWNRFTLQLVEPAYEGALDAADGSRLAVLHLRDIRGDVAIRATVAASAREHRRSFGAFRLDERDGDVQARAEVAWSPDPLLSVRAGGAFERRNDRVVGSLPETSADRRPGARATLFDAALGDTRTGAFLEASLRPARRLALTAGLRTDQSALAGRRTWDPRLAAAWRVAGSAVLTAAWGVYHQVPAPLAYEPQTGDPRLPPMESTHRVVGIVVGEQFPMLRVEVYHKSQSKLALVTRDEAVVGGGTGVTRGVDVFVRGQGPFGIRGRLAYSLIDARRTDADTGSMSRSPFDLSHAITAVLERSLGDRWRVGSAWRHATGRPFTPVIAAAHDPSTDVWIPQYGRPFSRRLPDYDRIDLSLQHLRRIGEGLAVLFVSVTNAFDRPNIVGYRYTEDYGDRESIPAPFRRTVYFGLTVEIPL